jgi:hypothetical protein
VCAEDDNSYSNGTTRWQCPPDDSGTKWAPTDGGGDAPIDALEPPYADVVADVPPDVVADAPPSDAPDE